MNSKIHPYAIIIGMALGIAVLLVLRYPIGALFLGFTGMMIADVIIKKTSDDKDQ